MFSSGNQKCACSQKPRRWLTEIDGVRGIMCRPPRRGGVLLFNLNASLHNEGFDLRVCSSGNQECGCSHEPKLWFTDIV